jgi:hypothetical protein
LALPGSAVHDPHGDVGVDGEDNDGSVQDKGLIWIRGECLGMRQISTNCGRKVEVPKSGGIEVQ